MSIRNLSSRERHAAEIQMHVRALEKVADSLEREGLYDSVLVRASANSILDSCLKLNDALFKAEHEEDQ